MKKLACLLMSILFLSDIAHAGKYFDYFQEDGIIHFKKTGKKTKTALNSLICFAAHHRVSRIIFHKRDLLNTHQQRMTQEQQEIIDTLCANLNLLHVGKGHLEAQVGHPVSYFNKSKKDRPFHEGGMSLELQDMPESMQPYLRKVRTLVKGMDKVEFLHFSIPWMNVKMADIVKFVLAGNPAITRVFLYSKDQVRTDSIPRHFYSIDNDISKNSPEVPTIAAALPTLLSVRTPVIYHIPLDLLTQLPLEEMAKQLLPQLQKDPGPKVLPMSSDYVDLRVSRTQRYAEFCSNSTYSPFFKLCIYDYGHEKSQKVLLNSCFNNNILLKKQLETLDTLINAEKLKKHPIYLKSFQQIQFVVEKQGQYLFEHSDRSYKILDKKTYKRFENDKQNKIQNILRRMG